MQEGNPMTIDERARNLSRSLRDCNPESEHSIQEIASAIRQAVEAKVRELEPYLKHQTSCVPDYFYHGKPFGKCPCGLNEKKEIK
jgi:hypothetical protein